MGYYGFGEAARDIGNQLGSFATKKSQEMNDKEYLEWLTGAMQPKAPTQIAPQAIAGMVDTTPIETQVQPPQPFADLGGASDMPMPQGNQIQTPPMENPQALLDAQKKEAAAALTSGDADQTMNMLVEARKRGVSQDMGSLLDFIAKQHQTAKDQEFRTKESDKAISARTADLEKTLKARAETEESRQVQKDLAQARREEYQLQRDEFSAKVRKEIAGMTGRKGPLTDRDYQSMSPEDLEAVAGLLDDEEARIEDPVAPTSRRDAAGLAHYRSMLAENSRDKARIRKERHAIERAMTLKETRGGGAPKPKAGAGTVTPPPAPAKRGVYNPATGQIEYQ